MPTAPTDARVLIPALSSALCWTFSALLLAQWRVRRRPYQLVWAIGLVFYALASGADALGNLGGWTESIYRTWYLCGAIAAAVLSAGVLRAVLIAAGAFAPSLTSTLNRFGYTGAFYWGELLGVLLIFAGFLASSEIISRRRRTLTPALSQRERESAQRVVR